MLVFERGHETPSRAPASAIRHSSTTKSHSIFPQHSLIIVRPRPQKAVKCLGGPGLGLVGVLWRGHVNVGDVNVGEAPW